MATIDIPTSIKIRASQFGLVSNTRVFESPASKWTQRLELDGARWSATYVLSPGGRADVAEIQAFLMKLRGRANSFNAYDPDAKTVRGNASGTIRVNGGSQTGSTLDIDGMVAGTANVFLPGDYFSVNGELKMVTEAVDADSNGEGTVSFEPPLRASPTNNDPLDYTQATCKMILTSDDMASWSVNQFGIYDISFSGLEVFE